MFSSDGTLISASAAPHCGKIKQKEETRCTSQPAAVLPAPERGGVLHQLLTGDLPADVCPLTFPPDGAARSAVLVHTVSTTKSHTFNSTIKHYYHTVEPAMNDHNK